MWSRTLEVLFICWTQSTSCVDLLLRFDIDHVCIHHLGSLPNFACIPCQMENIQGHLSSPPLGYQSLWILLTGNPKCSLSQRAFIMADCVSRVVLPWCENEMENERNGCHSYVIPVVNKNYYTIPAFEFYWNLAQITQVVFLGSHSNVNSNC